MNCYCFIVKSFLLCTNISNWNSRSYIFSISILGKSCTNIVVNSCWIYLLFLEDTMIIWAFPELWWQPKLIWWILVCRSQPYPWSDTNLPKKILLPKSQLRTTMIRTNVILSLCLRMMKMIDINLVHLGKGFNFLNCEKSLWLDQST